MQSRARDFYQLIKNRRTVRDFSSDPIPDGVIEDCLLAAGRAPNGANLQPWHFSVVRDQGIKQKIREAAEEEEREFYALLNTVTVTRNQPGGNLLKNGRSKRRQWRVAHQMGRGI